MSENTTASESAPEFTPEQLEKIWNQLSPEFQGAINEVNKQVDAHNKNVALIKSSKETDTVKLICEIRESNPENDPELAKLNADIERLNERVLKMQARGDEIVKAKYMPKQASEEEVAKATEETKVSSTAIRAAISSLETFETLIKPMGLALIPFVKQMQTTRGLALIGKKSGTGSGEIWRPRFSDIKLNGKSVGKDVKGSDGTLKRKATLTFLANELAKATKDSSWTTQRVQDEYLKAIEAAGGSKENPPENVKFILSHEYAVEGGTETMTLEVEAIR